MKVSVETGVSHADPVLPDDVRVEYSIAIAS